MRLLVCALLLAAQPVFAAEPIVGPVEVVDGDTWRYVDGPEIRPASIDAPELRQACRRDGRPWFAGYAAARWLAEYLHERDVICRPTGEKSYGRVLADCRVAGSGDTAPDALQRAIVRAGWAYDFVYYSNGRFAAEEAAARRAGRGVWQGTCQRPWDWRRARR